MAHINNAKKEDIGKRLKALRQESKNKEGKTVTQIELADEIGCSRRTILDYELGRFDGKKGVPDMDVILGLADYYGVSVDYLLCRTDFRTGSGGQYIASETGLSDTAISILQRDFKEKLKRIKTAVDIDAESEDPSAAAGMKELSMSAPRFQDGLCDVLNFLLTKKHTAPGCLLDCLQSFFDTSEETVIQGLKDNQITIQRRRGFRLSGADIKSGMIYNQIQQLLYQYREDYQEGTT